ncbi:MAG: anibiotic ABC transporter [Candidatus Woesebacteria bacterium]|jgi:ABC-2 type transport system permease protein
MSFKNLFSGTFKLFRLYLRCDRIKLAIWIFGSIAIMYASAWSVVELYKTPEQIYGYVSVAVSNAASRAFNGPILGATQASVVLTETFSFFTLVVAFASTLLVVRHTRQAEENGRAELVTGGAVGVFAPLTASLLLALCLNIALGATFTFSYVACGLGWGGSVMAGLAMGMVGVIFAAIAAIAAQITQTSRAANAIAGGAIGFFFLVRAVGDVLGKVEPNGVEVKSSWLTFLSPMGLARETQPLVRDNIWPVYVLLALAFLLVIIAFIILKNRDLGSGIVPVRRGPPEASSLLSNVFGLAWRQQCGLIVGWSVCIVLMAAIVGGMADEAGKFSSSNQTMNDLITLLGGSENIVKAYLTFCMLLMGVMVAAYTIQAMQKTRAEEVGGRLEQILACRVSRMSWLLSHVLLVALGGTLLLVLSGVATGLTYGIVINDIWNQTSSLLVAGLAQLPAVLIFLGFSALSFAVLPKISIMLDWLFFAACYVVIQFGEVFKLDQWVLDLSPFTHVPAMPSQDIAWWPVVSMTMIAVVGIIASLVLFRRRNLTTV